MMGWSRWRLDDHDVTVVLLEFFWKTDENYGVLDVFILALLDMCFFEDVFLLTPFCQAGMLASKRLPATAYLRLGSWDPQRGKDMFLGSSG